MNDDELRELTKSSMTRILNSLVDNYMKIYDEYYKKFSVDGALLKDLADSILPISEILAVYAKDKNINPDYAVRKLIFAKDIIDNVIEYFNQIAIFGTKNERKK